MNRSEFDNSIKEGLGRYLPEEFNNAEIKFNVITKSNDMKFNALIVRKDGSNIAPCIYIDKYYDDYKDGRFLDEILKEIADIVTEASSKSTNFNEFKLSKDYIAENVIFQIVSKKLNKDRLHNLEYKDIGNNLAITYAVNTNTEGYYFQITKDISKILGLDKDLLYKKALSNTPIINPPFLYDFENLMSNDSTQNNILDLHTKSNDKGHKYILTNKERYNGASALFYPGMMAKIATIIGGDYYIIPSSVHEIIILDINCKINPHELCIILNDINKNYVDESIQLGDEILLYSSEQGKLLVV